MLIDFFIFVSNFSWGTGVFPMGGLTPHSILLQWGVYGGRWPPHRNLSEDEVMKRGEGGEGLDP